MSFQSREALAYFCQKWREKYGKSYTVSWGKDLAISKRVLAALGGSRSEYTAIVDLYFSRPSDSLVRRSGHSLGVFAYQLNSLVAELQTERQKDARTETGNPDWDRLKELYRKGNDE